MGETTIDLTPNINKGRVLELCERYQITPPDVNRLAEFLGGMMFGLSRLQDRFETLDESGSSAEEYALARTVLHHDVSNDFLSIIAAGGR